MVARTAMLRIDNEGKVVWVNARPVHLTPKEYRLLLLLSSQLGRVFSREEILEYVWPERDDVVDPASVKKYVYFLRRKLESDPSRPRLVLNVRGFGYKLNPEVCRVIIPSPKRSGSGLLLAGR